MFNSGLSVFIKELLLLLLSYIAHFTVLLRTTLSASQSKGTVPAAHTTQMQLHPPHTQIVAANIHPPPVSLAETIACTSTHVGAYLLQLLLYLFLLWNFCHLCQRVWLRSFSKDLYLRVTAGTAVPLPQASSYLHIVIRHLGLHRYTGHSDCAASSTLSPYTSDTRIFAYLLKSAYRYWSAPVL